MNSIIEFPNSTEPQSLSLRSRLNFVIKNFQDFLLYVNLKAPNKNFLLRQQNVDPDDINMEVEDLRLCQNFFVDSELKRARHKVFNYARENLNANKVDEVLDHFFSNLKCGAKVTLAFGFTLKNTEDGVFSFFYAHKNNTLLDRLKLVCNRDDLAKLKDMIGKTEVIESCGRVRMNTKWRFYKLTNLTVFNALLKDVPMVCKEAVLQNFFHKKGTINCLTLQENTEHPYDDNLCLFRVLVLHLHGNQQLEEETSKFLKSSIKK